MSTISTVLEFTDSLIKSMDKEYVSVIYLDLKKAFDIVNHSQMPLI